MPEQPADQLTISKAKMWGYTKDFLSLLVIPLLLWGIKLEVGNALRDERIQSLQEENTELKEEFRAEIKEAKGIDSEVRANALKLAVLEGKLDTANGRLGEIINLLDR